jgi:hypothetical protein
VSDTSATPSSSPPAAAAAQDAPPAAPKGGGAFCFTDPGCRTEVRLGALIILGAVFLWLFFGPTFCSRLYMVGAPLLLIGIPIQALQSRQGRPGYPWKLGLAITLGGAFMWPDLRYREVIGGPVHVQEIAPLLLAAGVWILAWWPVARFLSSSSQKAAEEVSA